MKQNIQNEGLMANVGLQVARKCANNQRGNYFLTLAINLFGISLSFHSKCSANLNINERMEQAIQFSQCNVVNGEIGTNITFHSSYSSMSSKSFPKCVQTNPFIKIRKMNLGQEFVSVCLSNLIRENANKISWWWRGHGAVTNQSDTS